MVKSELVSAIASRADIPLAKAEEVIDLVFEAVIDTLSKHQRVELRGFGSLIVRHYESYNGRNPKTGETVTVPKKNLPYWKTGLELKQRVDSFEQNKEF